ncbi:Transient receptor potential cation channel subfamily M member 1 [Taenia solium]|eukprot:TsM_000628300 transcript=TsM_000628300 gene=TsM_000628300
MGALYLLCSIILVLNVIIAAFNSIYSDVLVQSELICKYLRYLIIIEYESRPLLPPPLIIISWIYTACRKVYSFTSSSSLSPPLKAHSSPSGNSFDIGHIFASGAATPESGHRLGDLKLVLKPEEIKKLHDFEEECVEGYWWKKQHNERKQSEQQLDNIGIRWAATEHRLEEVISCFNGPQHETAFQITAAEDTVLNLQSHLPPSNHREGSDSVLPDRVFSSLKNPMYKYSDKC